MSRTCNCIDRVKEELNVDFDNSLATLFSIKKNDYSSYGLRCVQITKTKTGKEKRTKTFVYMNFCPFCGKSYFEKEEGGGI